MGTVQQYFTGLLYFHLLGTIAAGDGKWKVVAPLDGEIIGFGGYIKTLGSGAGTGTDIQLRNETRSPEKDYFSSSLKPTFDVDAATNILQDGTLVANPTFRAGDILCLDVDSVSTNPGDADIWIVCSFTREVSL